MPRFATWRPWGMPTLARPLDTARLPVTGALGFAEIERGQFNVDRRGGGAM
jgi:hypothetical protein